jgi:hypothetical protein
MRPYSRLALVQSPSLQRQRGVNNIEDEIWRSRTSGSILDMRQSHPILAIVPNLNHFRTPYKSALCLVQCAFGYVCSHAEWKIPIADMNDQIINASCENVGQWVELSSSGRPFGIGQQPVRIERHRAVSFSIWANKPNRHMPGAFCGSLTSEILLGVMSRTRK